MIVLAISKEKDMELISFRNFKEVFDKCYEIKDFVKKDIYKWQISDFSSDDSELDEFDFHQKKYADFLGYCCSVIQKKRNNREEKGLPTGKSLEIFSRYYEASFKDCKYDLDTPS